VALEVDQVAAVFVGRGLEEVVEADVIQVALEAKLEM